MHKCEMCEMKHRCKCYEGNIDMMARFATLIQSGDMPKCHTCAHRKECHCYRGE